MNKPNETSRGDNFQETISTSICKEESTENHFVNSDLSIYGYNIFELSENVSLESMMFLQLTGELPTPDCEVLMRKLLILFANLGPRNTGARAAMNAGIGRTNINHIIPIALLTNSGETDGSQAILNACDFLLKNKDKNIDSLSKSRQVEDMTDQKQLVNNVFPGFGTIAGDIDIYSFKLLSALLSVYPEGLYLNFCRLMHEATKRFNFGVLKTAVFAAASLDLGLNKKQAIALFQSATATSFAAYGLEKFGKPLTEMPFLPESRYEIK